MSAAIALEYVKVLAKNGYNKEFECKCCNHKFSGSVTRAVNHFLGGDGVKKCPHIAAELFDKIQKAKNKELQKKQRRISTGSSAASQPKSQRSITEVLDKGRHDDAHKAVANFFYEAGVPFNAMRSPAFSQMVSAINVAGPGYKPPGYNSIRTTRLDEAKAAVARELKPFFDKNKDTGCTVSSDGWSDINRCPHLNVMVCARGEAVFYKSINMSDVPAKTGEAIADILIAAIRELGPADVVAVITDSAANCKVAGEFIEAEFPHIKWLPCAAHCLDLMLEDLAKTTWASEAIKPVNDLVNFIRNHQAPLAIFNSLSKYRLIKPGDTRFATVFLMCERVLKVKQELQQLWVHTKMTKWCKRNKAAAAEVKRLKDIFINSDRAWNKIHDLVALSEPIVKLMRLADSSLATMGKIYYRCQEVKAHLQPQAEGGVALRIVTTAQRKEVLELWKSRCDMLHSPLHAAAYLLDPEFMDHKVNERPGASKVMRGFTETVEKMVSSVAERAEIAAELAHFRLKQGAWAGLDEAAELNRSKMSGADWHMMYSVGAPKLAKVAIRLLSQPSSACACERNWSTFEFIHNKRRNKLKPTRAADLVYVFSNRRILRKMKKVGYTQEVVPWRNWVSESEEEADKGEPMEEGAGSGDSGSDSGDSGSDSE